MFYLLKIVMKKIQEHNPSTDELLNLEYDFQPELTEKLDKVESDFNQELINEIVWKPIVTLN